MIESQATAHEPEVIRDSRLGMGDEAALPLSISGLGKRYGDSWAVRGLDLTARGGEFISLLGPSGCGKTTTLRMIGGFEFPDEGEIRIGNAVMGNTPSHRRPTNTVFQSYALFPHLSVSDNVAYGLRQRRVSRADLRSQVSHALDLVRMTALADRKPSQLSGGQQQRVALARAIVNRPSVLLLDEPMSALDRKLREEMQLELKLLQQELGITFIFVTHDQEEALSMSERVAVMNEGRIEQFAGPSEVYDEPASLFVATFVGQQNLVRGVVEALDSHHTSIRSEGGQLISSRAPVGGVLHVGQAVTCTVRPESVTVTEGSAGIPNAIAGILTGVSRIGHRTQLAVAAADGSRILAHIPPSAVVPALGRPVSCSWDAPSLRVYPQDLATASLT